MNHEERWKLRFQTFLKTHALFERTLDAHQLEPDKEIGQLALTQAFEMVFEMSWKLMKEYLDSKGFLINGNPIRGSKDAVRAAFQNEIIHEEDAEIWMVVIDKRNNTSHLYNEKILHELIAFIDKKFGDTLGRLRAFFESELSNS